MDPATINTSTVRLELAGVPVAATVTYEGLEATLQPVAPLADSTEYTVVVTPGAQDVAGNPLAAHHAWSFTTGTSLAPSAIDYTYPADGQTNVSPFTNFDIVFDDAMDPATIDGNTFLVSVAGVPVAGVVTYNAANNTATFNPDDSLGDGLVYDVTLTSGARTAAGVQSAPFSFSFTSRVVTHPTVTLEGPADGAVGVAVDSAVQATFSEELNGGTVNTSTFAVTADDVPVAGTVTYANPIATFTPDADLALGTTYEVRLTTGIWSGLGQQMAADHVWAFTTS